MHIEKAYFSIFTSNKIYANRKTKFKEENNKKEKKKQNPGHVSKAKVCFMKERKGISGFLTTLQFKGKGKKEDIGKSSVSSVQSLSHV